MTPKEAMIAEFRHRFETGYSYDEYHITRVMALSSVESPKIRYVETTKGFVDSQFPEHAKERLAGVYLFNTNKLNEFRLSMTTSHCDSCNGFHDPKVMCPNRIFSQAKRVFGYREIVLAPF